MKATIGQLALSLYQAVENQPAAQIKPIIKRFVELLAEKHRLVQADKIIKEFAKLCNQRLGIVEAEVVSAKDLDKETLKIVKRYIAQTAGAREIIARARVDKSLLGGVIIKYGDKVLDGSLRGTLNDLKDKLLN